MRRNMETNKLTETIIGAAIEDHKYFGSGLLESAYESSLCKELAIRDMPFERQKTIPLEYKGLKPDCDYRVDVLVANKVVVEIKSVKPLFPIHDTQVLTYLKLGG